MNKKTVLIIEAHSDDSVISIGGFLEKFRDDYNYHFLLVTASDVMTHHSGIITRSQRLTEYNKYTQYFEGDWLDFNPFPLNKESCLDIYPRAKLVAAIEMAVDKVRPDILICTGASFHHDHTAVYEAVIAATRPTDMFFPPEIYITENPTYVHSFGVHTDFKPTMYISLTEEQIDKKVEIFQTYFPSQIRESGNYLSAAGIKAWARYRGLETRRQYAEALKTFMRII